MHTSKLLFAALFDANPEHAHFESPIVLERARALGAALGKAGIGIMARVDTAAVLSALGASEAAGARVIAFSPAANKDEHKQAFRLSFPSCPLVYTGRGALGADLAALHSSDAVIVLGSHPHAFDAIIDQAKDAGLPVGILSDEEARSVNERIRTRHPNLTFSVFVSDDSAILAREIKDELRRKEFEERNRQ